MVEYVAGAEHAATQIARSLEEVLQTEGEYDPPSRMDNVIAVFIGKVALELGTDSPFVVDLIPGADGLRGVHCHATYEALWP